MKKLFTTILVAAALCLPHATQAKVEHLLPKPQMINTTAGTAFALARTVTINDPTSSTLLQKFFTDNGCTIADGGAPVNVEIVASIEGAHDYELAGYDNEAYTLEITTEAINITAITKTGVIRAAQTLMQLAEGYEGPAELETLTITDWPAFKLRGYMHDVGRSFIEIETLKKHIELLSRFKVNTFHWHMTENQAWRFEVKAYPQLTYATNMTRFHGKYYTQEQCKELQDFAAERGVIVIPEIDMPGHSQAFKTAMGHSMQTDEGVAELQAILEEVAAVFDKAPYIHIGADEETISYPNFLKIMTDKVHSLGKKVVVWNPIRGVNITTSLGADMTQMWSSSGKVINGLPNIDCRYNYTNHFDVFADLVGIYKSNIYYAQEGNANIAGTISAPWNDRKTPTEEDIIAQNNFYANVIASAERAWIGGGKEYIEKGGTTLPNSGEEFDEFADWERRFLFHKANSLKDEPIPYVKQTNVRWRITEPMPNNGNASTAFAPEADGLDAAAEMQNEYKHNGITYGTGMATGAGIYLRHTWGNNTVPTYYGSTNYENHTAYAWTYVYSPTEQTVGAQIEFQNYGRSEKDTAPDAGKWDRKGSDIWLNGERIAPPAWSNTGKSINNEVDLLNENFTAREPIAVTLHEGWNKVFIKLPYVAAGGVRLNKWMFTFVLTDLKGKNAVEGLIYSPNKCMDAEGDKLVATIEEIKNFVASSTGYQPGEYNPELATELNEIIAAIEGTLSESMSQEERASQIAQLNAAFETFKASLATAAVNMPKVSNDTASYYYTMCTPLRQTRYATSNGANGEMVGNTEVSDASKWKFVARADGKLDIVNYADGTYVSPASNNNTALRTQAASPAAGWELKECDTKGLFIIVSGTVQFNQTNNNTHGFKVYNWGGGANTNDTGCQYLIEEATIDGEGGGEEGGGSDEGATFELIEKANILLEKVGPGYPGGEPREALQAAINAAAASPATAGSGLAAAIESYLATTDVVLPTNEHRYSLTMVAKNGNRFYLNYTGSDIAMVARSEGEELPESAKFICKENGNGTVSLMTADDKYLVYHSNYNGIGWLQGGGNTTGLQQEEDEMTTLTFAKMQNGNYVAATSNEDIFGLLTWYSMRGYDTGKNVNCYGYMVLKTDGSNYDGATAPFWNDNFSSGFLVEEFEIPTGIVDIKPEESIAKDIYDLSGRKLNSATTQGVYIINGKKILVK